MRRCEPAPCPPAGDLATAYAAGDWHACVPIIEQHWIHLVFHGHLQLLAQVLFDLPGPVLRTSSCLWHLAEMFYVVPVDTGAVALPTDPDEVAAVAAGDSVRPVVNRLTAAFIARRIRGHYRSARSIARATSAILDQAPPIGPESVDGPPPPKTVTDVKTFVYLHAGLSAHQADDPDMAMTMLRQAWREKAHDTTGFAARGTAVRLAIETAVGGEPAAAGRWLVRADAEPRRSEFAETFACAGIDLARLMIALDSVCPDDSAEAWVRVAENTERDHLWPIRTWALVRYALMHSAAQDALALIASVATHLDGEPDGLHGAILALLRADAYLSLGQGTNAFSALRSTKPTRYFGRVTEARTALLAGNHDEALSFTAETLARPGLRRRTQVEALLIQAVAELRAGSDRVATTTRRAASLLTGDAPRSAVLSVPRSALAELTAAVPGTDVLLTIRDELATPDLYPESIPLIRLTKREATVLDHLSRGVPRAELARVLFVSENTIKHQLRSLYAKLGAASRSEAVARARELGLLTPPE